MTFSSLSLIRGWRAALLLVAVALLSPQSATAACGDHVTILNSPATLNQHTQPGASATPEPLAPPCQGPNCSGAPVRHAPLPAPVTPVSPQAKEVVQSLGLIGERDSARSSFARDFASPRPIHQANSIFHPPRIG
ncbi:MAG: hypothetical protein L0241_14845 [Planctomycetia bacterium]|nr:hypothetical protein [Planctomycetia bacterium]